MIAGSGTRNVGIGPPSRSVGIRPSQPLHLEPPRPEQAHALHEDDWRLGRDGLWRNYRFGGSYKTENAVRRIGSRHGEVTVGEAVWE